MMPPRFEMLLLEDAPHGFSRDALDDSVGHQLACYRPSSTNGPKNNDKDFR